MGVDQRENRIVTAPALRLSAHDCIVDRIQQCKDCEKYSQVLCMKHKPYVKFNVLERWMPTKVKVLSS